MEYGDIRSTIRQLQNDDAAFHKFDISKAGRILDDLLYCRECEDDGFDPRIADRALEYAKQWTDKLEGLGDNDALAVDALMAMIDLIPAVEERTEHYYGRLVDETETYLSSWLEGHR